MGINRHSLSTSRTEDIRLRDQWTTADNDCHHRSCTRSCGYFISEKCEYLTVVINDSQLVFCPICGRHQEDIIPQNVYAYAIGSDKYVPGNFIVRMQLEPIVGNQQCIAVFSAVYESDGHIAPFEESADRVSVYLPTVSERKCQLFGVFHDSTTKELVWQTIEFTTENGFLVFNTDKLGMFVLMAE